jgi:hypothetical protein
LCRHERKVRGGERFAANVSSRKERIEQAKAEGKAGRFSIVPSDETEFIPSPQDRYPMAACCRDKPVDCAERMV